ncbi:apolipoprotein N-acyltransferase [Corticibacter populi]|uniref:Apolipoprotein N-acyltransferase n=1 Tax=Corticibacter populi TaxID=1550736 RepID=A0A3M6QPT9_9BURK|nr:apolipoprotein N-acyltransferase [Corticibacter populi]RMX05058.1 apolipoprotein N-acyltransferase [Corticibacter populi]
MSYLVTEHRLIRFARLLALVLLPVLGGLQAWALADRQGQAHWWVQIAAMAGFFLFLDGSRSLRQAAWRSWWFATSWLAGVFWWLFISMHTYGGLPAPLAAGGVLALAGALALYYVLAGMLYWQLRVRSFLASALLFAGCWTLAELARGQLLTGFPWGAVGYAQIDGPLAWLARYVGVYGVGASAAVFAALAAFALMGVLGYILGRFISVSRLPISLPRMLSAFAWLALLGAAGHFGHQWQLRQFARVDAALQQRPAVSLALLQGNIPIAEKFDMQTGVMESLQWYGGQFVDSRADLVIAPETAIPVLKEMLPIGYYAVVTAPFLADDAGGGRAMLTGIPLGNPIDGYTNSVEGFQPGAPVYTYSKHHLVPFGEFVPPMFQWFNDMMDIPLDDFSRGAAVQAPFEWKGERFAPNICYEDLFGEELALRFADAAQAPTVLVNFSNIGWFGNGAAVDQHLHISRMRTLELERPMVRATNTGATAIIDHRGQVQALAPRATRTVLHGEVRGIGQDGAAASITPFARWAGRFGLWPAWLAALAVVIASGALWRRLPPMR